MSGSFSDNQNYAKSLRIEGRAYINGQYIQQIKTTKLIPCYSPINKQLLQQVTCSRDLEIDLAVSSARQCFEKGLWCQKAPLQRKNILRKWAELIYKNQQELILLETLDTGKPISDVAKIDLPRAIACIEWFSELIDKVGGKEIPSDNRFLCLVTREPIGVVTAITPWNYPLLMAIWKIAPALAMGNSVILKPSEKTPLSAIRIAALASEAGLPIGALNVLPGDSYTGEYLSHHQKIDCVSFTGSGATGRKIMIASANSNFKRVWLELGGKSPNIIMHDCHDLKQAAESSAKAIFSNAGAICNAGSRLLVHREVKEQILTYLIEEARQNFQPGNPLNPKTQMGAIIDEQHMRNILDAIERGKKDASLIYGGRSLDLRGGGYYIEPTIFDCKDPSIFVAKEEIFGPVLSVITFNTSQEAISIANDTPYGLSAAVWTRDMNLAYQMSNSLQAGTVCINNYGGLSDMNMPFGGYKQSGFGRDNSIHALEKYSELKSKIIRIQM